MSYSNRRLIRKPHALLRLNEEEMREFEWLVQEENDRRSAMRKASI